MARWWDRLGGRPVDHAASPRFNVKIDVICMISKRLSDPFRFACQTNQTGPKHTRVNLPPHLVVIIPQGPAGMQDKNVRFSDFHGVTRYPKDKFGRDKLLCICGQKSSPWPGRRRDGLCGPAGVPGERPSHRAAAAHEPPVGRIPFRPIESRLPRVQAGHTLHPIGLDERGLDRHGRGRARSGGKALRCPSGHRACGRQLRANPPPVHPPWWGFFTPTGQRPYAAGTRPA